MRATALGMCAFLALCALALPASARAQSGEARGRAAAIFQAIVADLARSAEGVLLVDPREVRAGTDLTTVDEGEVGPVSPIRAGVLQEMGIQSTLFISDQPCLFTTGSPPPPGYATASAESEAVRQQCRSRPAFTSAIIGQLRPAQTADGAGAVAVTVVRMTTSSYSVSDYLLRECAAGRWRVVSTERLVGVQS